MTVIATGGPPAGVWVLKSPSRPQAADGPAAPVIAPDPNRPAGPAPAFDATILERLREALREPPAPPATGAAETRTEDPGRGGQPDGPAPDSTPADDAAGEPKVAHRLDISL